MSMKRVPMHRDEFHTVGKFKKELPLIRIEY